MLPVLRSRVRRRNCRHVLPQKSRRGRECSRNCISSRNSGETLRKELTDVRRQLADSNYEKEKYNSSNKELRDYVKRIEREKRE
jgi:molecular chaperone GrpE (heat shock protein)